MSTVYMVTAGNYDAFHCVMAFTSREAAEAFIERETPFQDDNHDMLGGWGIQTIELHDAPPPMAEVTHPSGWVERVTEAQAAAFREMYATTHRVPLYVHIET